MCSGPLLSGACNSQVLADTLGKGGRERERAKDEPLVAVVSYVATCAALFQPRQNWSMSASEHSMESVWTVWTWTSNLTLMTTFKALSRPLSESQTACLHRTQRDATRLDHLSAGTYSVHSSLFCRRCRRPFQWTPHLENIRENRANIRQQTSQPPGMPTPSSTKSSWDGFLSRVNDRKEIFIACRIETTFRCPRASVLHLCQMG